MLMGHEVRRWRVMVRRRRMVHVPRRRDVIGGVHRLVGVIRSRRGDLSGCCRRLGGVNGRMEVHGLT
jgi:hypothetical protein